MGVGYYQTGSGRQPATEFLESIDQRFAAQIRADIHSVAEYGRKAPVSLRSVTAYSPMWEIRTGNYRTFFYFASAAIVVLHVCKKEHQKQGIKTAHRRMTELLEG